MIYFVRHGHKEKTSGYDDYYNNDLNIVDEPLSDLGRQDAEALAAYLKDVDIKKIYVSQYKRTRQTAEPTARAKELSIIEDGRVNEINNGKLRNMSDEQIAAAFPQLWSDLKSRERDVQFPGGESGGQVKARQDSFLSDIKDERGDILVVSHDGFIRLLMCNILGLPVYKRSIFKTNMGCLSVIDYDVAEGIWRILRFNQEI